MKKIVVEIPIKASMEKLWYYSKDLSQHVRWDLRFSKIEELPKQNDGATRFVYETNIGLGMKIKGKGITTGEKEGHSSALHFSTNDWKSLIKDGDGSWIYIPRDEHKDILFRTVYDYKVRYGIIGEILNTIFFRPLMNWATRWSFDRLRIWLERGIIPEILFLLWLVYLLSRTALSFVWIWEGLVPKILFPSTAEIEMVEATGLALWDSASFIPFLGVWEIALGILLLVGVFPRILASISFGLLLFFTTILPFYNPELLHHPYGAITKNMGLIACSLIVLILDNHIPKATKCHKRPESKEVSVQNESH